MHTERYCGSLGALDRVKAIRAIQQAFLQLRALQGFVEDDGFDNAPALAALRQCLADAGHPASEEGAEL